MARLGRMAWFGIEYDEVFEEFKRKYGGLSD